ncbi:hypothetical protein E1A91_D06G075000v1 [Gossypium mustelinum]|uniref:Uncharacterized protein n=2 Tax=Gossypium TaxID=3633 RepID=A0A5J5R065_GOSBA|nr:hypothetical protein ES319_D06G073200v1 [Gossypium barbadense]TYI76411.1 hypothetical protein E1A91_D06G075000v1 [Gossypium mustelinum]
MSNLVRLFMDKSKYTRPTYSSACSLRIIERESPSISTSLSPRCNPRLSA